MYDEKARERQRRWERKNPHMMRFYLANSRARRRGAMPAWADVDRIKAFYKEAHRLTVETGIPHDVDHIVPFTAKVDFKHVACGLHCAENLQVLPATMNKRKAFKIG